jgi:hypothetical protein
MSAVKPEQTREAVAAQVCDTLTRHGIQVVLSGGAAAEIYAPTPYASDDLDFVSTGLARKVDAAMTEMGFSKNRQRHWTHPESRFWVEFPPGPVAVGDEVIHEFAERRTVHGTLRILTATDCVMDRLAWYYHDDDPQGLEQAVAVANANDVELDRIEAWSERERAQEKFARFRARLAPATR